MRRFTVRGPGKDCTQLRANNLDEALAQSKSRFPGKQVEADATEVIYVCDAAEDLDACQMRLQ